MKHYNTLSKGTYLWWLSTCTLLFLLWYLTGIFRPIDALTVRESLLVLFALLVLFVFIGAHSAWESRRNIPSMAITIAFPFGIYTLVSYYPLLPILWSVGLIVTAVLCVPLCGWMLSRRIHNPQHKTAIIMNRICRCMTATRTVCAVTLSCLTICTLTCILCGYPLRDKDTTIAPSNESDWTIANQIDTMVNLYEETWTTLSDEEKLNTLQAVVNIEARYLGLPHALDIGFDPLDEITWGVYRDKEHAIFINEVYFGSFTAEDALTIVCHEAYHAYQYRLCDAYDAMSEEYRNLLDFAPAKYYKQEFSNYTNSEDGFDEYYHQVCETRAREYSKSAAAEYLRRVTEYLIDIGKIPPPAETENPTETENPPNTDTTSSAAA